MTTESVKTIPEITHHEKAISARLKQIAGATKPTKRNDFKTTKRNTK